MGHNLKQVSSKESKNIKANNFIAAGVACYAFSLIDELGLLDNLLNDKGVSPSHFQSYPNPKIISSAFQTLESNGIVHFNKKVFRLTSFGEVLAEHRGSIGLIYSGYREVFSNQLRIAQDLPHKEQNLIDESSISRAAAHMGECFFHEELLKTLNEYHLTGTVCDLGCGNASTLLYICRNSELSGIGFDVSESSIKEAESKLTPNDKISVFVKDITKIRDIYPDVVALIQSFFMHDLPDDIFKSTFRSLQRGFPNAKIFLYVDAVSPSSGKARQLPGFDYVHSFFNIKPRTLEETSTILANSGFHRLC